MVESFQETIDVKYRQCFELVTVKRRSNDKPCLNNDLRRLIIQRDVAFKQCPVTYKKLRNKIHRMIKSAKTNFYDQKILHLKQSEPGKWHKQIRNLVGLKKRSSSLIFDNKTNLDVANELNAHFALICSGADFTKS